MADYTQSSGTGPLEFPTGTIADEATFEYEDTGIVYTWDDTFKTWTGSLEGGGGAYEPDKDNIEIDPLPPGSGTKDDPYILKPITVAPAGSYGFSEERITISGGNPGDTLNWINSTGGSFDTPSGDLRFKQPTGALDASGQWSGHLDYNDDPDSTSDQTYNGMLSIGSVYFTWDVTQLLVSSVAPKIDNSILSEDADIRPDRFDNQTFNTDLTLSEVGVPTGDVEIKAILEARSIARLETSAINNVGSTTVSGAYNFAGDSEGVPMYRVWQSIAYGGGRFVCGAQDVSLGSDLIMYSDNDGQTWTSVNVNSGYWRGMTYGNGRWVATAALGNNPKVMYSDNGGVSWTNVTTSNYEFREYQAVTTNGNGVFVAVGNVTNTSTGTILYSTNNAETWTEVGGASVGYSKWNDVTYGNGLFVAVGGSKGQDRVAYSSDGINWSYSRNGVDTNDWRGVAYGDGVFVAVADSGTNRVMYSEDATKWTSIATGLTDSYWKGITYGDGKFVVVSYSGNPQSMYSTDKGLTWTENNIIFGDCLWHSIAYGNDQFVTVSSAGSTYKVAYSGTGTGIDENLPVLTFADNKDLQLFNKGTLVTQSDGAASGTVKSTNPDPAVNNMTLRGSTGTWSNGQTVIGPARPIETDPIQSVTSVTDSYSETEMVLNDQIAYAQGKYICGTGRTIHYTTDQEGKTGWTEGFIEDSSWKWPSGGNQSSVHWSSYYKKWFYSTYTSKRILIARSDDGLTWEQCQVDGLPSGQNDVTYPMHYGNWVENPETGKIYIFGAPGAMKSTDGFNFLTDPGFKIKNGTRPINNGDEWTDAVFAGGAFFVCGKAMNSSGSNFLCSYDDGVTWEHFNVTTTTAGDWDVFGMAVNPEDLRVTVAIRRYSTGVVGYTSKTIIRPTASNWNQWEDLKFAPHPSGSSALDDKPGLRFGFNGAWVGVAEGHPTGGLCYGTYHNNFAYSTDGVNYSWVTDAEMGNENISSENYNRINGKWTSITEANGRFFVSSPEFYCGPDANTGTPGSPSYGVPYPKSTITSSTVAPTVSNTKVTLSGPKNLHLFESNDPVFTSDGAGSGFVSSTDVTTNSMVLQEGYTGSFNIGETIFGPVRESIDVTDMYAKLDSSLNVTDLTSVDPGYTMVGPAVSSSTISIKFPAVLPNLQTPDNTLLDGTSILTEVKASNSIGGDVRKSNTLTPSTTRAGGPHVVLDPSDDTDVATFNAIKASFEGYDATKAANREALRASLIADGYGLNQIEVMGLVDEDLGPLAIDGYYPLYTSETLANLNGDGTSHTHTFDGVTYYMPNGVTYYHGNYTGS